MDADPGEVLLEEHARTNGHVTWLATFIRQQDPQALVWHVTEETARGSGQFPGVDVRRSAAPSVWIDLYLRERKHLLEVARTIVALGIEERRQRLQEQELALTLQLIYGTVRALGHRPDDPAVRAVVLRQVQAMQGDVIEGVVAA